MATKNKRLKRHILMVVIGILLVFISAFFDSMGADMWADANDGVEWGESYQKVEGTYQKMLWGIFTVIAFLIGLTVTIYRSDLSEGLAVFLTPMILWSSGLEDLIFYIIRGIPLKGAELYWLMNTNIVTGITKLFGYKVINPLTLIISIVFGFILVIWINFFLYQFDIKIKNGRLKIV